MRQRIPLIAGQVFGQLTVVRELDGKRRSRSGWRRVALLLCSCGKETSVFFQKLRSGLVTSCGCASRPSMLRHGMYKTPTYKAWTHMKERCRNPKSSEYNNYGGRGITVDPRWDSFENFLTDMGERPFPKAQLDRIDNDGNYTPTNCRWTTVAIQRRNTRRNLMVVLNGESMCVADAAERLGISRPSIPWRARKYGISYQDATDFYTNSLRRYSRRQKLPGGQWALGNSTLKKTRDRARIPDDSR